MAADSEIDVETVEPEPEADELEVGVVDPASTAAWLLGLEISQYLPDDDVVDVGEYVADDKPQTGVIS
jgi:hypothetical protein